MRNRKNSLDRQTGVVLVVSLIMLLLVTVVGLTGAQVTSLEEKMAGNSQDQNIAFQAAESTLLEARKFLLLPTTNAATFTAGTAGLLAQTGTNSTEPGYFGSSTWTDALSVEVTGFGEIFHNNIGIEIPDPRYVIKQLNLIAAVPGVSPERTTYKITVRAQGLSSGTEVILQEILEKTG